MIITKPRSYYNTLGIIPPLPLEDAFVLIRLYQLPSDNYDSVQQITFATNSQNPVDMRDLRKETRMKRAFPKQFP
ncbi:MAG TPA: AIPR family protein [Syntrophomonas sp.]|nr:AIPR family protein [Syntrophomonas sp.]